MVLPSHGGIPREVDILIEFETDLHIPFKIAVEAKDHSRPIDSTGVENYIGKYNNNGGIVVNKVVIVAHAFSSTAKQRANDLGFSLHTLNELDSGSFGMFEQDNSDSSGSWWLSAEKGEQEKQVKVTLLDKSGNNIPLKSTVITPRTSKLNLGSASRFNSSKVRKRRPRRGPPYLNILSILLSCQKYFQCLELLRFFAAIIFPMFGNPPCLCVLCGKNSSLFERALGEVAAEAFDEQTVARLGEVFRKNDFVINERGTDDAFAGLS
jgi:hypothetical protein